MLTIYLSPQDNELLQINSFEKGCWINLIDPSEEEIETVVQNTGIFAEFLRYPLDDEERPHIEFEDKQLLTIIDVPIETPSGAGYDTIPLGIIHTDDYIVTVCLHDLSILQDFYQKKVRGMATYKKTRFLFQILYKNASLYLKYLREIDKKSTDVELELHKSMRNKELIKLLNLEKALVYFTTSLRSNESVLEKLLRGRVIKMYEEDQDLLEDVIIENKQAIEMADIYSNILSGTMDAFASIISNNLNIVMKFLAIVTIILALPTMVASFFGMNVPVPFQDSPYGFAFAVIISIVLSLIGVFYLAKKNMF
ncbi:MAG TPA: magnesium transporter CorA family protein [Peptococcaceae bacterium]|jgi:magnesium transporter|nr:magnesium transporter CorA family protein [Clostridia bacterium]HOB82613.1 magnesium transporter CorA family protein [Peptococcaceae bacterium]HPZ71080.1 magnesium transporter CorA family protein [Peptococcaceae bacterium]HQD54680.1 magnesium transporter CorA family protein [Peptococcaceae bacterium]